MCVCVCYFSSSHSCSASLSLSVLRSACVTALTAGPSGGIKYTLDFPWNEQKKGCKGDESRGTKKKTKHKLRERLMCEMG